MVCPDGRRRKQGSAEEASKTKETQTNTFLPLSPLMPASVLSIGAAVPTSSSSLHEALKIVRGREEPKQVHHAWMLFYCPMNVCMIHTHIARHQRLIGCLEGSKFQLGHQRSHDAGGDHVKKKIRGKVEKVPISIVAAWIHVDSPPIL